MCVHVCARGAIPCGESPVVAERGFMARQHRRHANQLREGSR
jgi:hypothetical protein